MTKKLSPENLFKQTYNVLSQAYRSRRVADDLHKSFHQPFKKFYNRTKNRPFPISFRWTAHRTFQNFPATASPSSRADDADPGTVRCGETWRSVTEILLSAHHCCLHRTIAQRLKHDGNDKTQWIILGQWVCNPWPAGQKWPGRWSFVPRGKVQSLKSTNLPWVICLPRRAWHMQLWPVDQSGRVHLAQQCCMVHLAQQCCMIAPPSPGLGYPRAFHIRPFGLMGSWRQPSPQKNVTMGPLHDAAFSLLFSLCDGQCCKKINSSQCCKTNKRNRAETVSQKTLHD